MLYRIALILLLGGSSPLLAGYDPLRVETATIKPLDLTCKDEKRSRDIPLRFFLPKETTAAPVVLFSHGLGGSNKMGAFLGQHWAARGFVAVFLQHPGSDESVWRDTPLLRRFSALKQAANAENFMLRVQDVPAVLDQLEQWSRTDNHPLQSRLGMKRVGMSGHSFGAVTTQAVSGQSFAPIKSPTDPRIRAAVIMSPSSPRRGNPKQAFGSVKTPWLLMTGTLDTAMIVPDQDVESRLAVFPALPEGSKYELVLYKGQHSAFTDRALPGEREQRNPNHHKVILALSTAFWDAYLRDDPAARQWLDGDGPRQVMEKADSWKKK